MLQFQPVSDFCLFNQNLYFQATKDCVAKTLKRLEEKIHGRVSKVVHYRFACHSTNNCQKALIPSFYGLMKVLTHLLYLMRVGEKTIQRQVALALAHLCSPEDQRSIFIDNNGMSCTWSWMYLKFILFIWISSFSTIDVMFYCFFQGWNCFLGFSNLRTQSSSMMVLWPFVGQLEKL